MTDEVRVLTRAPNEVSPLTAESWGWFTAVGCGIPVVMDASTVTVNDLLDGHTQLDIECLDRIYLNGYVPSLQVGGQVVNFMRKHLGKSIPSPAILEKIGSRFRAGVTAFTEQGGSRWSGSRRVTGSST